MQHNRLARCPTLQGESLDVEGQHWQRDAKTDHHDKHTGEEHEQVFLHYVNSVFLSAQRIWHRLSMVMLSSLCSTTFGCILLPIFFARLQLDHHELGMLAGEYCLPQGKEAPTSSPSTSEVSALPL